MNWLAILLFIIVIVCGAIGYFKGLIRTVVSLGIMIASVILTAFLSPIISSAVAKNDTVYDKIYKTVERGITSNEEYEKLEERYKEIDIEGVGEKADEGLDMIDEFVKTLNVPKKLEESICKAIEDKEMPQITLEDITDIACDYITVRIINSVVYVLVFLCVTLAAYLVLFVVVGLSKLPVIREFDSLAGMIAGVAVGVCVIAIAMVVITGFSNTAFGKSAMECINDNDILSWIYDNNPLWKVL